MTAKVLLPADRAELAPFVEGRETNPAGQL
jgi:hypothetical protein